MMGYDELHNKVNELSKLKDGWDKGSIYSMAIFPQVLTLAHEVCDILFQCKINQVDITPTPDGRITFDEIPCSDDKTVAIYIDVDEFSVASITFSVWDPDRRDFHLYQEYLSLSDLTSQVRKYVQGDESCSQ